MCAGSTNDLGLNRHVVGRLQSMPMPGPSICWWPSRVAGFCHPLLDKVGIDKGTAILCSFVLRPSFLFSRSSVLGVLGVRPSGHLNDSGTFDADGVREHAVTP